LRIAKEDNSYSYYDLQENRTYSSGGILRLWNPKNEVEFVLLKNIRGWEKPG